MKKIILEGKSFIDKKTTHKILKDAFEFPEYYGKNFDAFWDCITDYAISCSQEETEKVIWKDFDVSKNNLGEDADLFLEIFQRAAEKYGGLIIEVIP